MVLVTHDIEEAAQLADRVIVLSGRPGRIRSERRCVCPRPRELTHPEVVETIHGGAGRAGAGALAKAPHRLAPAADGRRQPPMTRRRAFQAGLAVSLSCVLLLVFFRYRALHKARPHTEEDLPPGADDRPADPHRSRSSR